MYRLKEPVHCLLVDDLEENLLALEALLQRDGLVCLKARSGEEALELLLVHDIALALLDVQMPGMDGFQLAEFMRGSERTRHVPIIFVTAGTADARRRFRGYEAGAVDFIQKPIEADILRSKARVFFDLYQQRRKVEAYADALKAADRNKNQFLAVLGHELRNPIMALSAGLSLLERGGDPERKALVQGQMQRQVTHLSRLVEDLLDIARIDQGKISLKTQTVALQDVVDFAVEASRPLIDAEQHDLTVEMHAEPAWLEADPARLAQVVGNLLNNAARYTPAGGRIRLSARTVDGFAEIEVEDNGIGIPPEAQSKIFDLFDQGRTPKPQEGLGVGLALVKQLVELHNGTIALRSEGANQGSTFQVRLPLGGAPQPPTVN